MTFELLKTEESMAHHIIVSIIGDGACLFRAIFYLSYVTHVTAREVLEQIVSNIVTSGEEFAVISRDINEVSYYVAAEYCI